MLSHQDILVSQPFQPCPTTTSCSVQGSPDPSHAGGQDLTPLIVEAYLSSTDRTDLSKPFSFPTWRQDRNDPTLVEHSHPSNLSGMILLQRLEDLDPFQADSSRGVGSQIFLPRFQDQPNVSTSSPRPEWLGTMTSTCSAVWNVGEPPSWFDDGQIRIWGGGSTDPSLLDFPDSPPSSCRTSDSSNLETFFSFGSIDQVPRPDLQGSFPSLEMGGPLVSSHHHHHHHHHQQQQHLIDLDEHAVDVFEPNGTVFSPSYSDQGWWDFGCVHGFDPLERSSVGESMKGDRNPTPRPDPRTTRWFRDGRNGSKGTVIEGEGRRHPVARGSTDSLKPFESRLVPTTSSSKPLEIRTISLQLFSEEEVLRVTRPRKGDVSQRQGCRSIFESSKGEKRKEGRGEEGMKEREEKEREGETVAWVGGRGVRSEPGLTSLDPTRGPNSRIEARHPTPSLEGIKNGHGVKVERKKEEVTTLPRKKRKHSKRVLQPRENSMKRWKRSSSPSPSPSFGSEASLPSSSPTAAEVDPIKHTCRFPNCVKTFSTAWNRSQHEVTHRCEREKLNICSWDQCSKHYFHRRDLMRHVRKCHDGFEFPPSLPGKVVTVAKKVSSLKRPKRGL